MLLFTAMGGIAAVISVLSTGATGPDAAQITRVPLRLSEANVSNGPARYRSGGAAGTQTLASSPGIDFTVFNEGGGNTVVTALGVDIVAFADLPVCYSQGGGPVPISNHSTATLPTWASGRSLNYPYDEEVPAGAPDRFVFHFSAPDLGTNEYGLYALRLHFTTSEPTGTLDAGRYVLAVPEPVSRFGQYLPEDATVLSEVSNGSLASRIEVAWCFRHNLSELNRIVRYPGKRSPQVSALGNLALAPNWNQLEAQTNARRDVTGLLESGGLYGPLWAAFAASEAGDAGFAEQVRVEAARKLVQYAAHMTSDHGWLPTVEESLRISLGLSFTHRAETDLLRVQRLIALGRTSA